MLTDTEVIDALYRNAMLQGLPTTKCSDGVVVAGTPLKVSEGLVTYPIPGGGRGFMAALDGERCALIVDRIRASVHPPGRRTRG